MDKREKLEKAKKVEEMRKNGDTVMTIMKALKLTYADYKKLTDLIEKNQTANHDDEFWKDARIAAEQNTRESLIELYLAEMATAIEAEEQVKKLKRVVEVYHKDKTGLLKELRRKDKEISNLKLLLTRKGDNE